MPNSTFFMSRAAARAGELPSECPPPCPACGGLECFCRPRFFPGQLLTDEDLNRLDHYMVEKNRLHNRYLHGHGIVCGLDVVCHPCDPKSVVVKPGYALSPCGDDIIVCKDSPVNICDLINRCRPVTQELCDPMHPGPTDTCPEGEQDWVLAICYEEKPSRGVAALRASSSASSCGSCACGGSESCGCGCHSGHNGNGYAKGASMGTQNKKRLAQCEQTLTCETYKFVVYRDRIPKDEAGLPIDQAYAKYWQRLGASLPSAPQTESKQEWVKYGQSYKLAVWEFISETQCSSGDAVSLREAINQTPFPLDNHFAEDKPYVLAMKQYTDTLDSYLSRYLAIILCQLFKLSCPEPVERNCIPLARIRVKKPDCQVVSICEASVREYVLSAVMERLYSFVKPWLTTVLGQLCCRPAGQTVTSTVVLVRPNNDDVPRMAMMAARGATTKESATTAKKKKVLGSHLEKAFMRGRTSGNIETLLLGLKGVKDSEGNPVATPEEIGTSASFLLANQVLRPALQSILPASWDKVLEMVSQVGTEGVGVVAQAVQPAKAKSEMESLKGTVAQLTRTVDAQAAQISTLMKRRPNK